MYTPETDKNIIVLIRYLRLFKQHFPPATLLFDECNFHLTVISHRFWCDQSIFGGLATANNRNKISEKNVAVGAIQYGRSRCQKPTKTFDERRMTTSPTHKVSEFRVSFAVLIGYRLSWLQIFLDDFNNAYFKTINYLSIFLLIY